MVTKIMRIALVANTFPTLSETFITRKAIALAKAGHKVQVVAHMQGDKALLADYEPLPPHLSIIVMPHTPRTPSGVFRSLISALGKSPRQVLRLIGLCLGTRQGPRATLRRVVLHLPFIGFQTELIHFEFLGLAVVYPLLGALLGVKTVVSCRGADLHLVEQYPIDKRNAYVDQLRSQTAVHCVSHEMAQEVARLSGRQNGLWVNRPAIEIERIIPRSERAPSDPPLIISIGRLVWKKGFDYLLNALAEVKRSGLAFRAEIVGAGPLEQQLRVGIATFNLENEVTLRGGLSAAQVASCLQQADIFALSSHEEGISNAVLEAMAAQLPVVVSDVGGMCEAVSDGTEGFVVPPRDYAALAERLILLVKDPALRLKLGKAGRQRIEAEFRIERQVNRFQQLYEAVFNNRADYESIQEVPPQFAYPKPPSRVTEVMTFAPLEWEHGLEFAIDAIGLAYRAGVPLRYTIVGSGSYRDAVVYAARQWGLWQNGCVRVVDNPDRLSGYAHILVHTPIADTIAPSSVMQASIHSKVKLIITDGSTLALVRTSNNSVSYVPRRDPAALATDLIKIAKSSGNVTGRK